MQSRHIMMLVTVGFVAAISGCFGGRAEDVAAFLRPDQAQVTSDKYIIQPPDEVTLLSTRVPELRGTNLTLGYTQTVRTDGTISVESVGTIQVAGKTPREVAELIAKQMSALYKLEGDYPIDVRVMNRSKYYYVIGEVRNQGAQMYSGRETTLSAVAKAVIDHNTAWEEKIQVIRPSLDLEVEPKIFTMNLKHVLERGDMTCNVLLQEGDIIYVPPTILTSVGRTVGEITSPILGGAGAVRAVSAPM